MTALSRVSAPISSRQQRHLAFFSEFNVQMLYLPGLKNIVADFLSRPSPPQAPRLLLKQSPSRRGRSSGFRSYGRRAKPLHRNAALARRFIPPTGLSPIRHPMPCWQCFNRGFSPYCPTEIQKIIVFAIFTTFHTFHIQGGSPPDVWCFLGLSGEGTTDITTWS